MSVLLYTAKGQRYRSQLEPRDPRMKKNNAGGYAYELDKWKKLERFLVLGTEGGTYYVEERPLTVENTGVVKECLDADYKRAIEMIVNISDSGRAHKNDPAIYAIALAASHSREEVRQLALNSLSQVCRIPTHLFHFVEFLKGRRGWGRTLKRGLERWYMSQPIDKLAHQMVKYQQRDGWSHRDVLRKTHIKPTEGYDTLFKWVVDGYTSLDIQGKRRLPILVEAYEWTKGETDPAKVVSLIEKYGLTREMIPTEHLTNKDVWAALLEKMPITAMIRNVGNMSKVGLLTPLSSAEKLVCERLGDSTLLRKGRVHPMQILFAMKVYSSGKGFRGKGEWDVCGKVVDALDGAFYASFPNVQSTGKRLNLALDVSGSMGWAMADSCVSCREAAAALALITANVEREYLITGFCDTYSILKVTPRMRLNDVVKEISNLSFGGTDCAIPMLAASNNNLDLDGFCVYTDNETWAGAIHPVDALQTYREQVGHQVKQVVIGMTSTGFSIADPNDADALDVVGFDANTPAAISQFLME